MNAARAMYVDKPDQLTIYNAAKVALSQISKYILSIFIVTLLLVAASNHPTIDENPSHLSVCLFKT
jgi:hypothetical protein